MCVQEFLPALLETEQGHRVAAEQAALHSSLQSFISIVHAEWYNSIEPDLAERLKKPLLSQVALSLFTFSALQAISSQKQPSAFQ